MKKLIGFTLAEAILTMTILGIIAATMVATLKPSQYKSQGFLVLKQKMYNELDNVTQTIIVECTDQMSLAKVFTNTSDYASCTKTLDTTSFDANIAYKYEAYMRGSRNSSSCADKTIGGTSFTQAGGIKLKNGVCIWFAAGTGGDNVGKIAIDVNGAEGPNATGDGNDQIVFDVGPDGITSDMPTN